MIADILGHVFLGKAIPDRSETSNPVEAKTGEKIQESDKTQKNVLAVSKRSPSNHQGDVQVPNKGTMSPPGLVAFAMMTKYISDPNAQSHEGAVVDFEVGYIGVRDDQELQEEAFRMVARKTGKRGRPMRNLAYSYVWHLPHFHKPKPSGMKARAAWLDEHRMWMLDKEERRFIACQVARRLGIKKAKLAWNLKEDGAHDLHLTSLNESRDEGVLQPMHSPGMRRKLVAISDIIHYALNLKRMRENRPTLTTMTEARARIAKEMGYELIA